MERLRKKFHIFIKFLELVMNLTRFITEKHFLKKIKLGSKLFTQPQLATATDQRGRSQQHSAPARSLGFTAVDRRFLAGVEVSGDGVDTYMLRETPRIDIGN